ncbi:site-2 protease family protein [Ornithinimicrobium pekingense]|uniref:Peptidase M50 n=1 Tax=Ornithinimicrobium pekingense TaxID=384677 RepID=A0ABQ2F9V3_9MICO|nr:site-2 protease family protein [Ornithinimicrobium pekingense]GGK75376.1 peptidase M50 [Ornithinimicrobium pekingense]
MPVYIGRSWFLVAAVIVLVFGPTVEAIVGLGLLSYVVALLFALLLLLSVLAHEAAHALVAQRVGFRVSRVVADFWGGHTAHDAAGATPARSAAVAVVGPLANGVLALLGWWLMGVLDGGVPLLLAFAFTWANAFVAIFNLVPGLPLDGGFLLEALAWRITGDRSTATWVAGWAGRAVAVLVVLWGLSPLVLDGQRVSITRFAWVFIIALFLWQGAGQAVRAGRHGRTAARLRLGDVARPVAVVAPQTPLAEVPWEQAQLWVVQPDGGEPEALVHPATMASVPDADRARVPASAVALRMPEGWAVRAGPDTLFEQVLEVMRATGAGVVCLLDDDGRPWGAVASTDLNRAGRASARS